MAEIRHMPSATMNLRFILPLSSPTTSIALPQSSVTLPDVFLNVGEAGEGPYDITRRPCCIKDQNKPYAVFTVHVRHEPVLSDVRSLTPTSPAFMMTIDSRGNLMRLFRCRRR